MNLHQKDETHLSIPELNYTSQKLKDKKQHLVVSLPKKEAKEVCNRKKMLMILKDTTNYCVSSNHHD